MRADNSHHIVAAARRRTEATRSRAIAAIRTLDATGRAVSFDAVARTAGVSRSWLYTQPDLREEIDRLRSLRSDRRASLPPARQRASDESLRRRLEAATTRLRQLEEENRQLRDQLARALGEQRAANPAHAGPEPAPPQQVRNDRAHD